MTAHPDEEFVRQAMLVCSILSGFSVQAVVRLVGSPPLEGKSFTHVLAMFAIGALILLYALAAGMIFFSTRKASFDERTEMVVDMKYGVAIGLVLFLLGLIFLTDLHSRRLSRVISVCSAILLILFVRLMIIDAAGAQADASQIGPDGNPRTAIIQWVAPPHFFQSGRIIVLFVGSDAEVLAILAQLLGPQCAGR